MHFQDNKTCRHNAIDCHLRAGQTSISLNIKTNNMACNSDFVQYVIDQCSNAGEIAVKKMMGDYCAYCDCVLFRLICDNNLYVKVTALIKATIPALPKPNAKKNPFK